VIQSSLNGIGFVPEPNSAGRICGSSSCSWQSIIIGLGVRRARRLFRMASSPNATGVAAVTGNVHTPTMTLKNAALLALIGAVPMTVLLVWNFVVNLLNLLRGLIPAVTVFSSLIYAFGCFSVMVFFFVFHRTQR
jgi:hypothetical protein